MTNLSEILNLFLLLVVCELSSPYYMLFLYLIIFVYDRTNIFLEKIVKTSNDIFCKKKQITKTRFVYLF